MVTQNRTSSDQREWTSGARSSTLRSAWNRGQKGLRNLSKAKGFPPASILPPGSSRKGSWESRLAQSGHLGLRSGHNFPTVLLRSLVRTPGQIPRYGELGYRCILILAGLGSENHRRELSWRYMHLPSSGPAPTPPLPHLLPRTPLLPPPLESPPIPHLLP